MIVYRDEVEIDRPERVVAGCRALLAGPLDRDGRASLLIEIGMLEAALADWLAPETDRASAPGAALRAASLAAARLLLGTGEAAAVGAALGRLLGLPWPAEVALKAPEGYAYYALQPEAYAAAARRFRAELGPVPAVCLGLRGIGTSLSAVVAAALEAPGLAVESLTLRPRGHPFDRRPVLAPELARWLAARAGAWFLVVDEGPGLSGSSFAGTAELLSDLGVPDERIAFFPSHLVDPAALVSVRARARWPRHRAFHVPSEETLLADASWAAGSEEVSAGGWRRLLYPDTASWPAVLPNLERRKHLSRPPGNPAVLHRFAGLGRFGERALDRANRLAAAGFVPPAHELDRGFLAQTFVPGRPLKADAAEPAFLRFAARYLAELGRGFGTGRAARPKDLVPMVAANLAAILGPEAAPDPDRLARHARALPPTEAVALDGRVLPHEWLATPDGYLKADALDHHADHGFPGRADIAWDVAALVTEFDLAPEPAAGFVGATAVLLGDRWLPERVPFHALAYLAFRAGQTNAPWAPDDGGRVPAAAARYRRSLAASLERLAALL